MSRAPRVLVGVVALVASLSPAVRAQRASEPAVKAALLVGFARFTDWPADALSPGAPLVMCVTERAVVDALLLAVTESPAVGGHPIAVVAVTSDALPRNCSVLYASGLDPRQTSRVLDTLTGSSVLSVSDSEAFMRHGGVIYLYVEDGRLRFTVNVGAADRARLRLSSKLLSLARIVKD